MSNVEVVDKALEQSSALIPELKNLRQEVVEQLKAIKSAFENSNRVNKLVKQDIERYINALPKIYPLFEGPDGARFLKRCAETAKTRRHHEVLLKIAEELDPAHLDAIDPNDFDIVLGFNLCRFDEEQVSLIVSNALAIMNKTLELASRYIQIASETIDKLEDDGSLDDDIVEKFKTSIMQIKAMSQLLKKDIDESQNEHYGQLYCLASKLLTSQVSKFATIYLCVIFIHGCYAHIIDKRIG